MNGIERDILKQQYKSEQRALRELKSIYRQASQDLAVKIEELALRYEETGLQSVIYQKRYQEAIKKQIDEGLKALQSNEYRTVNDFLKDSYENGFIGNVYSLHQQDIPITLPIDQKKIAEAMKIDSQLSREYYAADPLKGKLGENYDSLKFRVRSTVSRGIAQGSSWQEVAKNLALTMNSPMKKAMNDAMRIARTEGHRVNQQGFLDAGYEAKKRGAKTVKQWDATLDGRTRAAHRMADGQIREWDEDFDVDGEKLKAPGIGGSARNVINCRCCLLQRSVEAINEAELEILKKRAEYFGLDKSKDFEDFKKKYLKSADEYGILNAKIDELVPCLKDAKTGEMLETRVSRIVEQKQLKAFKESTGWNVDWSELVKHNEIYALRIKGRDEIQGLVACKYNHATKGMYLSWASAAPWNVKLHNKGKQKYVGVGGHLFAIVAEKTLEIDPQGWLYGFAKNEKIMQHYIDSFGAKHIPVQHPYQIVIDTAELRKLVETYNFEWGQEDE